MKNFLLVLACLSLGFLISVAIVTSNKPPTTTNNFQLSYPTDIPTEFPTPTTDMCDIATQYYWYCWNSGNPSPHHFGYPVMGDHYCTNRELGKCQTNF